MNAGVELLFRERERVLDEVESARDELAALEKRRKAATDSYNRARRAIVGQISSLQARADGLLVDFERLKGEDVS